jgi:hypothetical protein
VDLKGRQWGKPQSIRLAIGNAKSNSAAPAKTSPEKTKTSSSKNP